jgi:mono/diheme cytochrome c family protein
VVKRILIGLVLLVLLGSVGISVLAWGSALPPIDRPAASSFAASLVAKGEQLAGAGNCAACHTAKGGQEYAGGLGLDTGFGMVYTTNITPDPESGIGRWSEQAFARAMHEGIDREGSQLLPVFPYTHFTKVTDDDVSALYAFFMTRTPVKTQEKKNTIPFPLNIRALQAGWKILFFDRGVYQAVAGKSDEWNRGAYLAEGLGHCAACHTPRNGLGAEKKSEPYAGAVIDSWLAPALSAASPAPMPWTQDDLFAYLRSGVSLLHGVAAGSMSDVVHSGLAKLPDEDVRAIAVYFADLNGSAASATGAEQALAKAMTRGQADAGSAAEPGGELYRSACASCHYNRATTPLIARPELALSSTITGPDPANFIHITLDGIGTSDGAPGAYMPGFSAGLTDADVATLAAYLRRTRTEQPEWSDLQAKVAAIRKQTGSSP